MADDRINVLEDIIVRNAGPLGKFIIKKSMADLEINPEGLNETNKARLVDLVLQRAIFDESKRPFIRKQISDAWGD